MNKSEIVEQYLTRLIALPKTELRFGNPYQLLVSVVLSAQCTDKRVNLITSQLFKKNKTAQDILNLGYEQLEEAIKSCNFYHNKAKNIMACSRQLVEKYNGEVPNNFDELVKLPGVGRKTANVILNIAFDVPALAVDTHVFRVSNRIGLVKAKTTLECEEGLKKLYRSDQWGLIHHSLVLFGRYYCKAISPKCSECELKDICDYYKGKVKK